MVGEKNPQWRGKKVGIKALHDWATTHKPKPELCEICQKKKPQDLASIRHTYNRNLDEWRWLCRSCHMKIDIANGDRVCNITEAHRIRGEGGRYVKNG